MKGFPAQERIVFSRVFPPGLLYNAWLQNAPRGGGKHLKNKHFLGREGFPAQELFIFNVFSPPGGSRGGHWALQGGPGSTALPLPFLWHTQLNDLIN